MEAWMVLLELAIVLTAIVIGVRTGGIGLGVSVPVGLLTADAIA